MEKTYTGDALRERAATLTLSSGITQTFYPYIPSESLIQAVNLAVYLRRPLLLMGDPGSGKSILAESIAYEWYHHEPTLFEKKFHRWDIKSQTEAQDGIYLYDAISRLRQTAADETLIQREKEFTHGSYELNEFYLTHRYVEEGSLKKAIDNSDSGNPAILLIDEIDKAAIDFPNDLLLELDKFSYFIKETGFRSPPTERQAFPFVIITSNGEKTLPAAFLRRCIYHHIQFPSHEKLKEILTARFKLQDQPQEKELISASVALFEKIRNRLKEEDSIKTISTAELIDWAQGLLWKDDQVPTLIQKLLAAKDSLDQNPNKPIDLPMYQALLKNWDALSMLIDLEKQDKGNP